MDKEIKPEEERVNPNVLMASLLDDANSHLAEISKKLLGLGIEREDIKSELINLGSLTSSIKELQEKNHKKGMLFYNQTTITVATAAKPSGSSSVSVGGSVGYTRILVYENIHRIPTMLQVQNIGPGDLYTIVAHGMGEEWSDEILIKEGDTTYVNEVYELRARATTANTNIITSEYDYYKNRDFVYKTGLPYISETTVVLAGTPNTENAATALGKIAVTGYIINDGPGNLLMQISVDGITYSNVITIIPNQIINFADEIFSLRIDATINATAYRLNLH